MSEGEIKSVPTAGAAPDKMFWKLQLYVFFSFIVFYCILS